MQDERNLWPGPWSVNCDRSGLQWGMQQCNRPTHPQFGTLMTLLRSFLVLVLFSPAAWAQLSMTPVPAAPEGYEAPTRDVAVNDRSEEHTSELQSLMRISYAVFCLKKKTEHRNILKQL